MGDGGWALGGWLEKHTQHEPVDVGGASFAFASASQPGEELLSCRRGLAELHSGRRGSARSAPATLGRVHRSPVTDTAAQRDARVLGAVRLDTREAARAGRTRTEETEPHPVRVAQLLRGATAGGRRKNRKEKKRIEQASTMMGGPTAGRMPARPAVVGAHHGKRHARRAAEEEERGPTTWASCGERGPSSLPPATAWRSLPCWATWHELYGIFFSPASPRGRRIHTFLEPK